MYHRVLPEDELHKRFVQPGMYVLDHVFEDQMRFLQTHFEILSFGELLQRWKHNEWETGKRYCVITFDDGWLDNYLYAYPILRRLGIPATIFLATGFIGTREWFWPDKLAFLLRHSYGSKHARAEKALKARAPHDEFDRAIDQTIESWKSKRRDEIEKDLTHLSQTLGLCLPEERNLLSWEEVLEMSRDNVSFGSHSWSHAILTRLAPQELGKEIHDSMRHLQDRGVNWVPVFCYPNGEWDDEVVECVKAAGYQGAVVTEFGWEGTVPQNLFRLRRVGIHHDIGRTLPLFLLHISGFSQFFRRSA